MGGTGEWVGSYGGNGRVDDGRHGLGGDVLLCCQCIYHISLNNGPPLGPGIYLSNFPPKPRPLNKAGVYLIKPGHYSRKYSRHAQKTIPVEYLQIIMYGAQLIITLELPQLNTMHCGLAQPCPLRVCTLQARSTRDMGMQSIVGRPELAIAAGGLQS